MLPRLVITLSSLLALTSCVGQYDIAGRSTLEDADGHMLYLRVSNNSADLATCEIDSCEIVHGRFSFGGDVDSVVMAQLCMGNEIMMPIVLENGQLRISIDPVGQVVQGGQLNRRLYDFLKKRDRMENELWQVEQECIRMMRKGANIADVHERMVKRTHRLNAQIEEAETRFVEENYNNALGPGYFIMLCNQQIFPVMTGQLQRIADGAPPSFLDHPFIANYLHMAGYNFNRPRRVKR